MTYYVLMQTLNPYLLTHWLNNRWTRLPNALQRKNFGDYSNDILKAQNLLTQATALK